MLSSWSGSWNQMTLATAVKRTVCSMLSLERIMCRDWRNVRTRRTRNCQYQAVGHFRTLNPLLLSSSPPVMLLDSEEGSLSDKSVSLGSSETGFVAERGAFPGSFGLDGYSSVFRPLICFVVETSCKWSSFFSSTSSFRSCDCWPFSRSAFSSPLRLQHSAHLLRNNGTPYKYYLNRSHYEWYHYNKSQEINWVWTLTTFSLGEFPAEGLLQWVPCESLQQLQLPLQKECLSFYTSTRLTRHT